jgi:hypothetical protein
VPTHITGWEQELLKPLAIDVIDRIRRERSDG